jgi:hypothetical protein
MTFESDKKLLETFSRMLRLDDNAKSLQDKQRVAFTAKNSNPELEDRKDFHVQRLLAKLS